jgi:hypothetical protein
LICCGFPERERGGRLALPPFLFENIEHKIKTAKAVRGNMA